MYISRHVWMQVCMYLCRHVCMYVCMYVFMCMLFVLYEDRYCLTGCWVLNGGWC